MSFTELQVPLLADVRIRVTFPFEISTALGVYVVLIEELFAKVPPPKVVHIPALVLDVPFKVTIELLAQTVWSDPAFIIGFSI